jgi:dTDP-4-amino-4,6-dideoxygalactose transaminase
MKNLIPYGRQYVDTNDINSVIRTLKKDFITQGSIVGEFEKKFANYTGSKYAVAVSSASAGLHLSCLMYSKKKI